VRLLVLGGTQFVGRALVETALGEGAEVTLFHRGQTNPDLFPDAEHLHGDRDGGLDALGGRTWDACVDACGYVPRVVRDSAELLTDAVETYVFVSTISVYSDLSEPCDEDGPLATMEDETTEDVQEHYGGLKVLCEQAVRSVLDNRAVIVRPGFVVGPHDHTGRFTWWVHRAALGGTMVVPASLARRVQMIDARDLGDFLLHAARSPLQGTFNATGPFPPVSMLDVLAAAGAAKGRHVEPVVIDDGFLAGQGLGFNDLPFWIDDPVWKAWAEVDVKRAMAAGLRFSPLEETIDAVLMHAVTTEEFGLTREREAEILAAWRAR
jgi:2'-hydroxyisoflavone reductase